ncbi:WAT1-related protein At5g40230 isoform X3 [Lactuca sativa]|uniref:WAT1-related protein At5g40230 isoform X3 n=1 Tax=Lactuca sativa TaxID=4236 RepID=UPI001C687C6F|nr:WAT1-related protein At5g40230 isoform X3 [Lactuca sativa]
MKEYVGMVAAQIAQVLLIIVSKYAIADGMSNYSFIFYSNALASLILLPLSLIFHRSGNRPPLTIIVICGFFIIGVLGYLGILVSHYPLLLLQRHCSTSPQTDGFRMEAFDLSLTTQAKFIGTVVSIAGAIIITLYKGPSILSSSLKSEISQHLLVKPSDWVLGGIFIAITSILSSMCFIGQATVLKKYPAEVIVMFSYCIVYTILSALASFIVGDDLNSYSLRPKKRLLFVLYSGIFGSAFQFTVQAWCLKR